jgi:hypothetical protein
MAPRQFNLISHILPHEGITMVTITDTETLCNISDQVARPTLILGACSVDRMSRHRTDRQPPPEEHP